LETLTLLPTSFRPAVGLDVTFLLAIEAFEVALVFHIVLGRSGEGLVVGFDLAYRALL
jgi:hypothetical protein